MEAIVFMLNSENSDPSRSSFFLIKRVFFLYLSILLIQNSFLGCGRSEKVSSSGTDSETKKQITQKERDSYSLDSDSIPIPTNPIPTNPHERLLEYKVYLVFKSEDLLSSREKILMILQKNSILKKSEISFQNDGESLRIEIITPVTHLYTTLIELSKVGRLISEKVETIDWTEENQKQKFILERETIRAQRRAQAGKEGSAASWTWKEREELLERSENNYDTAKLQTWKIQDSINWAKIFIQVERKESLISIQVPNIRNAFVSGLNFIFKIVEIIIWLLPIFLLLLFIYFFYRRYKKWY